MKIAITLVHNKTDLENVAQINALKALLKEVVDGPFVDPDTGQTWTTTHHEITGLNIPHEVKVYQVIPYNVTPPANRYSINSGGIVEYTAKEPLTGHHPRFFNWGLKRGTDNGADVFIYLSATVNLNTQKIKNALNKLVNNIELLEENWGKIVPLNF